MRQIGRFYTVFSAAVLAVFVLFASTPPAEANPKYASVVMDMETGQILRTRYADKKLYPASLTKMMTLYMTFDAIRSGKLSLDQELLISRNASRQPPSKIGLRAGRTISVREAIQACATKSANDAAVVLAEAIGGSVDNFAALSTQKARELGMSRTTFKNPHGLTKRGQLSTARDMAVLGRRLFLDFPEHYHVFKRKVFKHGGRKFYATNKLLGRYSGADGIKTGYTSASGFNLVASAEQNGRRVLGVVFGGRSSASRNRHMRNLLDEGFAALPERTTLAENVDYYLESPLPRLSPKRGGSNKAPAAWATRTTATKPSTVARSLEALSNAIVSKAEASTAKSGPYSIQIGAYRKRVLAERRLNEIENMRRPANLKTASPFVSVRNAGGRPLYRARFVGLQKSAADRACKRLRAKNVDCFVVIEN